MKEDKFHREANLKINKISIKLYVASALLGITGGAVIGIRTEEFNSVPLAVVLFILSMVLFVISNTILSNKAEFVKEAEKIIREKLEDEDENIEGT